MENDLLKVDAIEMPTVEQVAWVFEKLCDHLQQGGTFRYLIYDRMGFGMDAYFPLYVAGGMAISNAFSRLRDLEGDDDTCGG